MARYWAFRIDTNNINFLRNELDRGRLRQGWGWRPDQDLRDMTFDGGASRNRRMFNEVKKDDILLVPHLPDYGQVTIVQAKENWNSGYEFDLPEETRDHGHSFPAKKKITFYRQAEVVSGGIRSTFRCHLRFWNIDHLGQDIETICKAKDEQRNNVVSHADRLAAAIDKPFNSIREELRKNIYEEISHESRAVEWEYVLEEVLRWRYPGASVENVAGREEKKHGTDLKITIPGFVDGQEYVIAVQVKAHEGQVPFNSVINQISKAEGYWQKQDGVRVVDQVVIFTRAIKKEQDNFPPCEDVTFVFADDLKELIMQYALGQIR